MRHVGAKEGIGGAGEGLVKEWGGPIRAADEVELARRREQAPGASLVPGGEAGRSLEGLAGRRVTGSQAGAGAGLLERPGDLLVGSEGGGREVPGTPRRCALAGESPAEGAVGGAALMARGGVVNGGAQEGMAPPQAAAVDRDESRRLRGLEGSRVEPQGPQGARDRAEVGRIARGGHDERAPGLGRQRPHAAQEHTLEAGARR